MSKLSKILKVYRYFMIIFGFILGVALFLLAFIYGGHDIMDSLGISLIGFVLPLIVHLEDRKWKQ